MTEATETTLSPGFMVVHGNQPDALRSLLVSWIRHYPLPPLDDEVVLVQSNGIAQWLKLALARDTDDGGCGIAAAIDAQLPSRFTWQAYRAVLGRDAVPLHSPFDKSLLLWRLMRLLPVLAHEAVFAPLQRFLSNDGDLRRRYQLAERLADLFDQYQVYRADWLADWAQGSNEIVTARRERQAIPPTLLWQPRLWRALSDDVRAHPGAFDDELLTDAAVAHLAASSRADIHRRFLAASQARAAEPRPAGLPRRLIVFGISSLPQQALEVLSAIANWTQVLMCVHNPCEHYWADIIADKDLLRAQRARQVRKGKAPDQPLDASNLYLHAHPLLAAWGKQGRDFIGLLDEHDERERYEHRFIDISKRIDLFESNGDATLLQQLQDDIRTLRPLHESRAEWPPVDCDQDHSIRFHIAHSTQREVEILHDQLLAALSADPTLRARDIIVMVPDIHVYAPHIQAVFGLLDYQDPRFIPFRIADQGQRHQDPLLGALEKLLHLPQSRLAVSDVLDLLEVPALRRRFGIEERQLPLLQRWIRSANIRWGLHAEQRRSLDLPVMDEQNSWFFGVRRMLLGYAVGGGAAWQAIEPLDEMGGLDAALLGPLVLLLDALERHWRQLSERVSPDEWDRRLRALLSDFFAADEGQDGFTLLRLDNTLDAWLGACRAAGLEEALPLSVVRDDWLQQLDQQGLSQPFFGGAVTFATLMPMRAIPFRHLCLLGMGDGDYPRTRVAMDFDLMARDYRPGDRSRREDDRYLFLEAVLSARDHLHISWVGFSIHDNSPRPPSVLVAQLRDHLQSGWTAAVPGGAAPAGGLLDALTVQHRLQPFNRDYFTQQGDARLFSFAREWRLGLLPAADATLADAQAPGDTGAAALSAYEWDGQLTLLQLQTFARDPVRAFFRQRLNITFDVVDPVSEDHEPFALDGLENWQLQDELIQAQAAAAAGEPREAALQTQLARIERRGALPAGHFAAAVREQLAAPMDDLFRRYQTALADWPHRLADDVLDYRVPDDDPLLPAGLHLADWLDGIRANDQGERARVLLHSGNLVSERQRSGAAQTAGGATAWRRDRIWPFWIAHLAGHMGGASEFRPLTTVVVSKKGTATLLPLTFEAAQQAWRDVLVAWCEGMRRPLPLAVRSGFAWLEKGGKSVSGPLAGDAAIALEAAYAAARATYEEHDPARGQVGERAGSVCLERAWPTFAALWADGEFSQWAARLLQPMMAAIGGAQKPRADTREGATAAHPEGTV